MKSVKEILEKLKSPEDEDQAASFEDLASDVHTFLSRVATFIEHECQPMGHGQYHDFVEAFADELENMVEAAEKAVNDAPAITRECRQEAADDRRYGTYDHQVTSYFNATRGLSR